MTSYINEEVNDGTWAQLNFMVPEFVFAKFWGVCKKNNLAAN